MISHWRKAGELLDLSIARMDSIYTHRLADIRQCCRDVLQDWVNIGSSDYPATWGGLLSLLDDLELHECAKSLQAALECSPNSVL